MTTPIVLQGYRIGAIALAAEFDSATELAVFTRPARVPNSPEWLLGLRNLHGHPVPVFDLAPLLATEHAPDSAPMLLVVGRGDALAGMLIDGLPQRLRFGPADRVVPDAMPGLLAGYVRGAYQGADGTVWLEFDAPRFFEDLADMLGTSDEPARQESVVMA